MKLLKDYDCTIQYRPRRANVIADALSQKSFMSGIQLVTKLQSLTKEFAKLALKVESSENIAFNLWEEIKQATTQDNNLMQWVDESGQPKQLEYMCPMLVNYDIKF